MLIPYNRRIVKRYFIPRGITRYFDLIAGCPLLFFFGFFVRKVSAFSEADVKNILIIKLAAVGDTVLLSPVIASIKKRRPKVSISLLVTSINRDIAEKIPYVDSLLLIKVSSPVNILKCISLIRKKRFDAVFDLEQWSRGSGLIAFFSGGMVTAGFNTPFQFRHYAYNMTVAKSHNAHEIDGFYDLVNLIFPVERSRKSRLLNIDSGKKEVHDLLSARLSRRNLSRVLKKKGIVIHPGCGPDGTPREWPLYKFFTLASWLIDRYNAFIYITSGPDEVHKSYILAQLLSFNALDIHGQLSWGGIISLLKDCDLVISGNTGIMHIAAILGKPQVALHGPTNIKNWGPLNSSSVNITSGCPECPCLKLGYEYHRYDQSCMDMITIEEVKDSVKEVMELSG